MSGSIPNELRKTWDEVIASEGTRLGVTGCRPFLENKLVNDIFYEGEFGGVPCVVKCSSRAVASIQNEYEMSRRLTSAAPGVCADALAMWRAPDASRAFVVTRRLPGPSLTEMFMRGVSVEESLGIFEDMVRIAEALTSSGIVWRDVVPDNMLMDADGHLKLIDAQFAIDRNDFHEDPYMKAHWKYRTLLFAFHPMIAGRGWDDVGMLLRYARYLPNSDRKEGFLARLRELERASAFPVAPTVGDKVRTAAYLVALVARRTFVRGSRRASISERVGRAWSFLTGRRSW